MDYLPGIEGEGVPRVLACFMASLLRGEPLKLVDGGKNRRCFTYIRDAVEAVVAMLRNEKTCNGKIFNIGNPANETTIKNLADMMIAMYQKLRPDADASRLYTQEVPSAEFYGPGYEDCDRRVPDISAITQATGWKPATGLAETLEMTIRHYLTDR
jgi:UDP-apiose/xylose synthase